MMRSEVVQRCLDSEKRLCQRWRWWCGRGRCGRRQWRWCRRRQCRFCCRCRSVSRVSAQPSGDSRGFDAESREAKDCSALPECPWSALSRCGAVGCHQRSEDLGNRHCVSSGEWTVGALKLSRPRKKESRQSVAGLDTEVESGTKIKSH